MRDVWPARDHVLRVNGEGEAETVETSPGRRLFRSSPAEDGVLIESENVASTPGWGEQLSVLFQTVLRYPMPHGLMVESIELLD